VILLDTHAWIWWVSDPDRLSRPAARIIKKAGAVGVSAISCWELTVLVSKKRIHLDREVLTWMNEALALDRVSLVALTPAVAAMAMNLRATLHGDPGDRLIAATAILEGATLVTRDEKLQACSAIRTVW
jgi:PIN domain nuclease of toxin-antitoxin system